MDILYSTENKRFKYRVSAVIIDDGKILVLRDEISPYSYLPGGKVKFGETAEQAIIRELEEELRLSLRIVRPLWLVQSFYNEDVNRMDYHEINIYYLVDGAECVNRYGTDRFTLREGKHVFRYEWIALEKLKDEYFYPLFLKKSVLELPGHLTMITEHE